MGIMTEGKGIGQGRAIFLVSGRSSGYLKESSFDNFVYIYHNHQFQRYTFTDAPT
jgi:hypothetical protein